MSDEKGNLIMQINLNEIIALKALIGNCDIHLLHHILSSAMDKQTRDDAEQTLIALYNRIYRELEDN